MIIDYGINILWLGSRHKTTFMHNFFVLIIISPDVKFNLCQGQCTYKWVGGSCSADRAKSLTGFALSKYRKQKK